MFQEWVSRKTKIQRKKKKLTEYIILNLSLSLSHKLFMMASLIYHQPKEEMQSLESY